MTHLSQTELIRLAAGDLSSEQRHEARSHLDACASCRRALENVRSVGAWLDEWTIEPSARDTWPDIERTLEASAGIRPAWAWMERFSRVAAVILLGVGSGFGAGWLAIPHSTGGAADLPTASAEEALAAVGFDAIEAPSATGLYSLITPETSDSNDVEVAP
ncbi:MAG TPA: zf-HC2 domain-containing protein [Phycisphaerae bacterium]|nr:zf-HC2 domain-containing protein [Phycisphaerae bacterium]HRW54967.1 zf-HC2 domain-containing protein [Phycisphaerae bacterium]